ncbi:MAG: hypothetical protein V7K48_23400 [Nostoc sp.]|uniref:hypothetical protein n=1 Tax=Nostoc sp. TaxID=1180 RepID=UPI002FFAA814
MSREEVSDWECLFLGFAFLTRGRGAMNSISSFWLETGLKRVLAEVDTNDDKTYP